MRKTSGHGPQIVHVTLDTGARQTFNLTNSNFDPVALARVSELVYAEIGGFRLVVSRNGDVEIKVLYRDRLLTVNRARRQGDDIVLETRIVGAAPSEVMMMAADLEQCAAIALLRSDHVA